MQVTSRDVKAFLQSVRVYQLILAENQSRYLTAYEKATKTTTRLTGMPRGGGNSGDQAYVEMVASRSKLEDWESIAAGKKERVIQILNEAPLTELQFLILHARYIQLMNWKDIIRMLKKSRKISERSIYYEHNAALAAVANWANIIKIYTKEILGT